MFLVCVWFAYGLALPFVLDGLGQPELEAYNSRQVRARDRLSDPVRPIIGALNEYLHAYHMYRAEAPSVTEIVTLDTKSRQALDTLHWRLQRMIPYSVTLAGGRQRSVWCTEKAHSTTQVTKTRMKSAVKTKARKTNNQALFGQSLLKNNTEVEAVMELSRHLDETGSPTVCMLGLHQICIKFLTLIIFSCIQTSSLVWIFVQT